MYPTTAVIVTSINPPTNALFVLADGCHRSDARLVVVGDTKSPSDFKLAGADFFDIAAQIDTGLAFAKACPTRHYARKNIGYLIAIRGGATLILETDDDNIPRESFFAERSCQQTVPIIASGDWLNVYSYFSDENIWPRGLPLNKVKEAAPPYEQLAVRTVDCPIQQGLADENPDVDAVYRLLMPLPQSFRPDRRVALAPFCWCPFNSQNTAWWPEAFPLLYLPAHCSFRMTDIWRSFVAQRIASANGWHVLFHEPNVWQERNEHDLMRDFSDEIPGYLHNDAIRRSLEKTDIRPGVGEIPDNMIRSYQALIELDVIGRDELGLLDAWLRDLASL